MAMVGPPCGDDGSFTEFYKLTVKRTLSVARGAAGNDLHLAYDATQDAYVEMLQRWNVRKEKPRADNCRYVATIAVNKVVDWHRRQFRFVELPDGYDYGQEENGFAYVLEEMSNLQLWHAVLTLIAQQPNRRREVAALYFIEKCTYADIADTLAITQSTVRTHVERMRVLMKPLVDRIAELGRGGGRP